MSESEITVADLEQRSAEVAELAQAAGMTCEEAAQGLIDFFTAPEMRDFWRFWNVVYEGWLWTQSEGDE